MALLNNRGVLKYGLLLAAEFPILTISYHSFKDLSYGYSIELLRATLGVLFGNHLMDGHFERTHSIRYGYLGIGILRLVGIDFGPRLLVPRWYSPSAVATFAAAN